MSTEDLKTCSKCKEEKPRSEFQKNKIRKDGLCYQCKQCRKQHYKENVEKIRQYRKQHYKENIEKIRQYRKQHYKENKEKILKRRNQYRKENAEKIRQYRKENAEKIRQRENQYRKENAEKIRQHEKQYYKKNAEKIKQREKQYHKNLPAAVYKIENTKTGQVYIGQSTAYNRRWNSHKSKLRRNKHGNPKLQEDCNKYGLDAFEFEIIKEFPSDTTSDVLLEEETRVIAEYAMRGESLYNLSIGFEEFRKFLIEDNNKS
jgi:hypothetical protein